MKAHGLERGARCGKRCREESEGAALMTQVNGLQQLLWIRYPPLATATATWIHKGSAAVETITGQQLVGGSQPGPGLSPDQPGSQRPGFCNPQAIAD